VQEKRGAPRYRCQMPCVVRVGTKCHDAKVLDLSRSGLSIRTELELAQGDEVGLVIEPEIEFQAIVWRTMRTQRGFVVGMMLCAECSAYDALVGLHATRRPEARASASPLEAPAPPPPLPELWWRLRVKDGGGNRTRMVALEAPSRDEAIARTLAEIGGGWEILEAELAPRAPIKTE